MESKHDNVVSVDMQTFLTPISILIAGFMISVSVLFAFKDKSFTAASTSTTGDTLGAQVADTTGAAGPTSFTATKVSVDDDAVIGDLNTAKAVIVEFSDYECPFCKRHYDEVYGQIINDYVNAGKVAIVFRDFPLSFHDPVATNEAIAAECVKKLGGNGKYFEYHDGLFTATGSNGTGLVGTTVYDLAEKIGINRADFTSCYDNREFADEVAKDLKDGSAAGVGGTPGFIVGKLNENGEVEGVLIDGAYPIDTFKTELDKLVN